MKIMGLTGGIASGKSTVSQYLAQKGIPIIDADIVAREVVAPDKPLLAHLVAHFGSEILLPTGTLNRRALGEIVFNDANELKLLNELMDPAIRTAIMQKITAYQAAGTALVCLDAPTLFEAHYEHTVDFVVVVYVSPEVQLTRLKLRDNLSLTAAQQRIAAQISIDEKRRRADYVIDNQGDLAQTYCQVDDLLAIVNSLT
ncbi:dephospho-CoA kinase [Periweissella ghanensis]|uniref:Dephospho-CoA kinase n=1 Tax=Periweissella ghanensis TaxID=467997 RepID=A0ABN8BPC5_9LACO|nr:dephospho-CoA kinase [Periweissella ghanensis]MCM0600661.1 dephospho-CoA kinase [Periweissella ghanensis]CAH0418449.1 Dephospho-CoA kinase [Periweissella ghanensis]